MLGVFGNFTMHHLTTCQALNSMFRNSKLKCTLGRRIFEKHLGEIGNLCTFLFQLKSLLETSTDTDEDV